MHCIRRGALRAAISASRQVAPKASVSPLAQAALKPLAAPKQSLLQSVRCFTQTARFQNVEEQTQEQQQPLSEPASESTPENSAAQTPARPKLENGLFVRNLIFDATEKHLVTAFEKYGEVVEASIARDARGLSRGYGFVYFKEPQSVDEAISAVDGTFWHGRRVAVSRRNAEARATRSGPRTRSTTTEPTSTLYIGNIPYETTDAELNQIFRDLADVTDIRVAVDRTTGWPRGFAHADFASVEAAQKASEKLKGTRLGDRDLVIDYAATRKVSER